MLNIGVDADITHLQDYHSLRHFESIWFNPYPGKGTMAWFILQNNVYKKISSNICISKHKTKGDFVF